MASPDLLSLAGQRALVTGAATGIGKGIVEALAKAGADVALNYRSHGEEAEKLARALEEMGRKAVALQADVSKEAEVISLFDSAERELGPIDIVISNAGLQRDAKIADMTLEDWNAVIEVNLTGSFLVAREAIRRFRAKGMGAGRSLGKLVFNSSVHQRIPWAFHANYAASKGGLKLLMESLAQEVAPERIRVNAVGPGAIATAINAAERDGDGEKEMLKLIPYGRIGEPEDIGRCVAWLVSDAADYVVGQTLFVDGAMTLYPAFRGNG